MTLSPSHTSYVTSLAFSSDHSFLASCSNDGYVNLWSPNSSWTLNLHLNNMASCNAILQPDIGLIAASSYNNTIIWDLLNNVAVPLKMLVSHSGPVSALALSPDKSLLASGATGSIIVLWSYKTQSSYLKGLNGHTSQVRALLFVSNQILVSGSWDLSIKIWNVSSGKH